MPTLEEYKKIADLLYPNINKTIADYLKIYPERNLPQGAEVTRFAPSPTGYMHIGGVYQCLVDRQIAKTSGGVMILRNEDTDSKREVEGAANIFVPALKKFGIEFDEGFVQENLPDKGAYGPYTQSKRKEIYQAFAKELVSKGLAYPCFCSEADEESKKEQLRLGVPTGYYGRWAKCRNLSYEQVKAHIDNGDKFTIRIKSNGDGNKKFKFKDLRMGETLLPVNSNDYVLLKSDGLAVYHMAHLVDDTLMHTTTVVRDESWFPSVPLHVQLFEYCGLMAPKYFHTATINTIDAETGNARKVSKRKDSWADARFFHEKGYPAEAVVDYLMNIINSNFEDWRAKNPDASVLEFGFNPEKMSKSGAMFDLAKLDNISKNIISRMSGEKLFTRALAWAEEYNPDYAKLLKANEKFAKEVFDMDKNPLRPRKDITTYSELPDFYSYMFDGNFERAFDEKYDSKFVKQVLNSYAKAYTAGVTKEEWFDGMKAVAEANGFATDNKLYKANPEAYKGNMADFSCLVRVAVTGRRQTPDLYAILALLGKDEVISRLSK